jgi:putative transposase
MLGRYTIRAKNLFKHQSSPSPKKIPLPVFIVIKAADEFRKKTTAIHQLWKTDFTYLKVLGWGYIYLSNILDDYSRYMIA